MRRGEENRAKEVGEDKEMRLERAMEERRRARETQGNVSTHFYTDTTTTC